MLAVLLSACVSGSSDVAETSTSVAITTTTVAVADLAFPYFEELAKYNRVAFENAAAASSGPAKEYAYYLKEYDAAKLFFTVDNNLGFGDNGQFTTRKDEKDRILIEGLAGQFLFSDFEFDSGKLNDFKIEGRKLSANLMSKIYSGCVVSVSECQSDESLDLEVLHAYITSVGDFIVTYSFRIGAKYSNSVREDRDKIGLANHVLTDSLGNKIKVIASFETFSKGEIRTNAVLFSPLSGGGNYSIAFKFRVGGKLLEWDEINLGNFEG